MLLLALKAPCAVWYPRTMSTQTCSISTPSQELKTLAKATEVCILFDTSWLGRNLARLRSALEGSLQLTGASITPDLNFTRSYQKADWSNFVVEEETSRAVPSVEDGLVSGAPPPIEDAVGDAPPPYARLSSKRPRHSKSSRLICRGIINNAHHPARTSLTPDSPSPKRVLFEYPTCPPSPTERATSILSPSAKSSASSTTTVQVDMFRFKKPSQPPSRNFFRQFSANYFQIY